MLRTADTRTGPRQAVIALMAFLTLVDLFATQAILPWLARAYGVSPAAMGTAVNACALGMATASLGIAWFSHRIDRRRGIVASLVVLAVPTALLSVAPDVATFAALRVVQGLCMASAFTLTLAYLAEATSGPATAAAFAAYVTGNVASNLFGRLLSATLADTIGLAGSFHVFAVLNLVGAVLAFLVLAGMPRPPVKRAATAELAIWRGHLASPTLRAAFAIGFLILFAFIGTFTYVGFVLARPPLSLGMMAIGLGTFVFLPSIVTTPATGKLVVRLGARTSLQLGLGVALVGLPLLLTQRLGLVLMGLTLVAIGTFLAQATATGIVGRAAKGDPGSASGLYLASYFLGGLTGSAVLGALFMAQGWPACVVGIGLALALAGLLARRIAP